MNTRVLCLLLPLLTFAFPSAAGDVAMLASSLKQGGHVIVFRHVATDDSQKGVYPFRFDDMRAQRQLSDKGREAARAIGAALRAGGIPLGDVYASRLNRAVETARLVAGKDVTTRDELTDSGAASASKMANPEGDNAKAGSAVRSLVNSAARPGVNAVLVTHKTNITDAFGKDFADIGEGEALIFRPAAPAPVLVARIKAEDWANLR